MLVYGSSWPFRTGSLLPNHRVGAMLMTLRGRVRVMVSRFNAILLKIVLKTLVPWNMNWTNSWMAWCNSFLQFPSLAQTVPKCWEPSLRVIHLRMLWQSNPCQHHAVLKTITPKFVSHHHGWNLWEHMRTVKKCWRISLWQCPCLVYKSIIKLYMIYTKDT